MLVSDVQQSECYSYMYIYSFIRFFSYTGHYWVELPVLYMFLLVTYFIGSIYQLWSVQSLSCVWLFVTPWTAACQTSLFFTISHQQSRIWSYRFSTPSLAFIVCRFFWWCLFWLAPELLPGESQGWWSLVVCRLWGRTESNTTEAT